MAGRVRRAGSARNSARNRRDRRRAPRRGRPAPHRHRARRIEVEHQRAGSWCAGNGPGRWCRARRAARRSRGIDEFQHRVLIVEMPELALRPADPAADLRHQARGDRCAAPRGRGSRSRRRRRPACPAVRSANQSIARLMMSKRQLVAVLGGVGPGEQAVALEHDALGIRIASRECSRARGRAGSPGGARAASRSRRRRSPASARASSSEAAIAMIASGCMWSTCV